MDAAAASARRLRFGLAALATSGVVLAARQIIGLGIDAEETGSKFRTVFGPAVNEANDFLDRFATQAGLSRVQAQDLTATTAAIAQGMGFATRASARFATEIVEVAGDLASFNNLRTEDTLRALTAAIVGEREPLKRLGIVIREVDVQKRALASSSARVAAELTQQERATATLELITERAGVAIGDLERTKDSAANTARRLSARYADLKTRLGELALPGTSAALTILERNFELVTDAVVGLTLSVGALASAFVILKARIAFLAAAEIAAGIATVARQIRTVGIAAAAANISTGALAGSLFGAPGLIAGLAAGTAAYVLYRRATRDATEEMERQTRTAAQLQVNLVRLTGTQLLSFETEVTRQRDVLRRALAGTALSAEQRIEIQAKLVDRQNVLNAIDDIRSRLAEFQKIPGIEIVVDTEEAEERIQRLLDRLDDEVRVGLTVASPFFSFRDPSESAFAQAFQEQIRSGFQARQNVALGAPGPQGFVGFEALADGTVVLTKNLQQLADSASEAADGLREQSKAGTPGVFDSIRGFLSENIDLRETLSNTAANLLSGGISTIIGGVTGAIGGFLGGLFGESESDRRIRLAFENTESTLRRVANGLERIGDPFGSGLTGTQLGGVESVISSFLSGGGFPDLLGDPRGFARTIAVLESDLGAFGLTLEDLTAIAKGFGVDLQLTTASFEQLQRALELQALRRLRDDPTDLASFRAELLDFSAEQQIEELLRSLSSGLAGTDFGSLLSAGGFDQLVKEVVAQITTGTIDQADLGELTPDQFLDLVRAIERLQDSTSASADEFDRLTRGVQNAPRGFRVGAFEFLATDVLGGGTTGDGTVGGFDPRGRDRTDTTFDDPRIDPSLRPIVIENLTIMAQDRSMREVFDELQKITVDQYTAGTILPSDVAQSPFSGSLL